ncbi:MAG TPA: hypothetical protein VK658_07430 [Chryseolinea sp.]|nr:hypothetical protein [Chryseolinea sp.]
MKQFTLLPSAAEGLRKALLIRMLFLGGVVITVVFIVPMIMTGDTTFNLAEWITLLFFLALSPIMYFVGQICSHGVGNCIHWRDGLFVDRAAAQQECE